MSRASFVVGLLVMAQGAVAWADDVDGDGVDDAIDVCNNTPPGTAVDAASGRPLGDIDLDCDTDLEDHALSQQGFTGPLAPPAAGVVIATVPVGNPGNSNDTHGDGYGGVADAYNIGKYEVTAGQYTEFLNAVADDDTYGLYNINMLSGSYGCKIRRTGSLGSFVYLVDADEDDVEDADWVDRPVNYVSWGDAARFANWLHNGQPTGAQDLSTTEDGSYFLDGATSNAELLAVVRAPDATWVLPSEDEWYKAAYHKNDGATGNYFEYPTSSNSVPGYVNDSGNLSGTGTPFTEGGTDPGNYATYDRDFGTDGIGSPYYRTSVGEWENSDSPYGTFDQGGNVWEWNEAVNGSFRGVRGGSFSGDVGTPRAAYRNNCYPANWSDDIGFRVAEVP